MLHNSELKRRLEKLLRSEEPPLWVREMIEHHRKTGSYRPQDLRKLLGDPAKGVEAGPASSLASSLANFKSQ